MKAKSSDDIDEWDKEFINVDQGTLFEIILAANYMDIQGLLDLGTCLYLSIRVSMLYTSIYTLYEYLYSTLLYTSIYTLLYSL